MRTPIALALLASLAACGSSDRRADPSAQSAASTTPRGPDPVVLRVPREGGPMRAYVYPRLDTAVWMSDASAPAPARVIGFDPDAGSLVYVDGKGVPRRADLRVGGVTAATGPKLRLVDLVSSDGSAIFGLSLTGGVIRVTPSGETWTFSPAAGARGVFPQRDGAVVVLGGPETHPMLWRVRPPGTNVADSTALVEQPLNDGVSEQAGDRIYLESVNGLVGVRAKDLRITPTISLGSRVRALVSTPSGDRLYVALVGSSEIAVVDRYQDKVGERIPVPGQVIALRMDPLGRYVLARPEHGDSAWIIAMGTGRVIGTVHTPWLADLPMVAPDGALLLAQGSDVVVVDAESMRPRKTVAGGAKDFWAVVTWNGFRPRAKGLDRPLFADSDSVAASTIAIDSSVVRDSTDTTATVAPKVDSARSGKRRFVVSFASLLDEPQARETAAQIHIGSETARVVTATVSSRLVYRVVLGPYLTREEADRIGRTSKRSYWVVEETP